MRTVLERCIDFIEVLSISGCWYWTGYKNNCGYGKIRVGRKSEFAHRVLYSLLRGPIPDDKELDHKCKMRQCVNPDHLEAVTHRENILRGKSRSAKRAKQTHCIHGHPLSGRNLYMRLDGKGRQCRVCSNSHNRKC